MVFELERIFLREMLVNYTGFRTLGFLKYMPEWKASLNEGVAPFSGRMPWFNYNCRDILKKAITSESKVFEYGGGGSSLYFLDIGATVVTVEHDKEWFDLLSNTIVTNSLSDRWTVFFRPPKKLEKPTSYKPSNLDAYISGGGVFEGYSFEDYVKVIDQFCDEEFDLVIVDGRSRPSCMKHAISKVKPGGYLLLDNTERSYYLSEIDGLLNDYCVIADSFGPTPCIRWFTKTTIWQKNQ